MTMAAHRQRGNPDTFTQVMAAFPAGVAVVTAFDAWGRPRGLTTTAVTSVSLDPPLLLVCVDLHSRTLPAIRHSNGFALNIIDARHAPVARHFASKADDKFAAAVWRPGAHGHPILHGHAVAWAECRIERELEVGDHAVIVGELLAGGVHEDDRTPLMYLRRGFGRWIANDPDDDRGADRR
jgi:flavin reductase (NADH)